MLEHCLGIAHPSWDRLLPTGIAIWNHCHDLLTTPTATDRAMLPTPCCTNPKRAGTGLPQWCLLYLLYLLYAQLYPSNTSRYEIATLEHLFAKTGLNLQLRLSTLVSNGEGSG